MNSLEFTDHTIVHGRALVRAIEALGIVEFSDPFERAVAELFQAAYKRRLMEILEAAPSWTIEKILGASTASGRCH